MAELGLDFVVGQISEALRSKNISAAENFLWPALDQKPEAGALWFYAGVISCLQGKQAIGYECFRKSHQLEPHEACWPNMGGALRHMGLVDQSRLVLEEGRRHCPDNEDILANLIGAYVNEGNPWPGIRYGEELVAKHPNQRNGQFNLALLYLEAGEFAKGFDLYAQGDHRLRQEITYNPDPPKLTPELHEKLKGTGAKLIVHGEQGIGDELMMATMLRDARQDYEVIFDCHPRLESLYEHASWRKCDGFPVTLHATRKTDEKAWSHDAVAKTAIGNLAQFYRRTPESFAWRGRVYKADPAEVREMRAHLESIAAGRRIIGLALYGGTMHTGRTYRKLHPKDIAPLLSHPDYLFVSLDYEDCTGLGEWFMQHGGPRRFLWYPSVCWAWDYAHQAALVAATDALVTVCQSIAHLGAAMAHPTYVLTPSKPAWRYGVNESDQWYWYNHPNARLLRQKGADWEPAVRQLTEALQARFPSRRVA
jgi:tetratricopeptide (TPR) repeat protein